MYTVTPVIITKASPCGNRPERVERIEFARYGQGVPPKKTLRAARDAARKWLEVSGQTDRVEIYDGALIADVIYPQD
jgi:hypothetical protein